MNLVKRLYIILSIYFIIASTTFGEGSENLKIITLEEAVNISIENNPQIKISKADIDISKADLKNTKSVLYPQIESRIVVPFVEAESGFFLDQLIWDFGRTQNDIKAQRYDLESKAFTYDSTESSIVKETKISYLEALIAKNNVEIQEAAIKTAELLLEKTKEFFDAGIKSEMELGRSQINLHQEKLNHLDSMNSYKIAKLNLSRIMGKEINSDFDVEDALEYEKIYLEKDEMIELASSLNNDIKSVVSQQAGLKAKLNSSKSNFFPKIFGRVAYRFDGEGSDEPDFIAGIGIRLPIFQGFSRLAKINRST
ncbi:MAG: TolC family protein, partial [Thermodesulfobacteriota bacterium]